MRICLVYDCLYPHTVGGAERWYRNLAERLARDGHEVTYLTLRQWERGEHPAVDGVRVLAVGPRMQLYGSNGRRRLLPPLVFGAGVLWHLLLRGRRYGAVHTASFPYFSVLAAALARPLHRFRLVVDWHEVWTRDYWREYLGRLGGWLGWTVQRLCIRVPQRAFCFSQLNLERLQAEGLRGEPERLPGLYAGPSARGRTRRRRARRGVRGPAHPGKARDRARAGAGPGARAGARAARGDPGRRAGAERRAAGDRATRPWRRGVTPQGSWRPTSSSEPSGGRSASCCRLDGRAMG